MSEEVLSQAEVESLLSAIDPSRDAEFEGGEPSKPSSARKLDKVSPYDFKRPERVGKEQMRALQSLHEGFGRNYSASLSAMLRSVVDIKLTSVDQLTFSEFIFSLENPTCFNILEATPLEGNLILDINPSILHPIIDRLLGGKDTESPGRRALTEIELRLVTRITRLFLDELQHAWDNVLQLELSVVRVESNPQLVSIVPPNEVVVLISFELTLGTARGMMNLCIPYNSIERFSAKLASNTWQSYGRVNADEASRALIGRRLVDTQVELRALLAETTITTADLIGLRVGDIITTNRDVHGPLDVTVAGVNKFRALPGAVKGHKAIQISDILEPRD